MSFVTDFFNHFSEKAMISESVKSTHILIKSILFTRLCTLIWKSCSLFVGLNSSDVLSCVSSRPGLGWILPDSKNTWKQTSSSSLGHQPSCRHRYTQYRLTASHSPMTTYNANCAMHLPERNRIETLHGQLSYHDWISGCLRGGHSA